MEAAQWGPKAEVVIVDRRDFLPREARVGEPWRKERRNLDYIH
jgi:hypothetical protein